MNWGTPYAVSSLICQYHCKYGDRGSRNIYNQVFYETESMTPEMEARVSQRSRADEVFIVNPQFIEWVMGYPTDYTLRNVE